MNESIEVVQAAPPPAAKRSWIERSLVWGAIAVLLAVVLVEWSSKRSYELTLDELDTAIRQYSPESPDRALLAADVGRYVHGFTFRGNLKHGTKQYQTFRWPSFFRFYKLIVLIDGHGIARTVDAYGQNPEID